MPRGREELGLVGGLLAYVLWFRGITTLPVTSVAVLGLLSPMVAALLGAMLLGQSLGSVQLAGFALCMAAIVAGQISPAFKKEQAAVIGSAQVGSRAVQ